MMKSKSLPTLLLSLLLALAGCGDPVVDTGYRGDTLLSIQGQLRTTPDYTSQGPLHVALVWFPNSALESADGAEVPDLFMTAAEDMVIGGQFPLDYRFDVFQPPPPEALGTWGQGLKGKGALGFLLAYEDLNGNGKLDRIPRDGAPQDRVVGASFYESRQYMVLYADTAQDGVPAGFSLAAAGENGQSVFLPASTKLALTLTQGGDAYDALVCEAGFLTYLIVPVCGLGGDGSGEQPPLSNLGVAGDVRLKGGHLEVSLQGSYSGEPAPDLVLTLGGRALPYDAAKQAYVLSEDASTLLTPGAKIRLEASGHGEHTFRNLQVPGDFSIGAPGEGQSVSGSAPFTVSWTAAAGATAYRVELDSSSYISSNLAPDGALTYDFEATHSEGAATLRVEAIANGWQSFDSFYIDVAVVQERQLVFAP